MNQEGIFPVDVIKDLCNCGHSIDHPKVGIQRIYGFWMGVAQLVGVTPIPKQVIFYCRECGREFASTTDKDFCDFYAI